MNTGKFNKDLKFGLDGENLIINYLAGKGLKFINDSKSLNSEYQEYKKFDLLFKNKKGDYIRFEVKSDKFRDTGNLAVEKSCNGIESGIKTTSADYWVYFYPNLTKDNIWTIKTKDLKNLIKDNQFHIASGGDNNKVRLYIFNRHDFREHFKIETLSPSDLKKLAQIEQKRYRIEKCDLGYLWEYPLD